MANGWISKMSLYSSSLVRQRSKQSQWLSGPGPAKTAQWGQEMRVARPKQGEAGRSRAAQRQAPGRRPRLVHQTWAQTTQLPEPERAGSEPGASREPLPSVSLPLLHSWAKQAKGCGSCGGAVLLGPAEGPVRAQRRSQTGEWRGRKASQLLEPRKELCQGGHLHIPAPLTSLQPHWRLPAGVLRLNGHQVSRHRLGTAGTVPSQPRKF